MNTKERIIEFVKNQPQWQGGENVNFAEFLVDSIPIKEVLQYHNELLDANFKSIVENEDLKKCVDFFFECDLNIAETSRKSYLHRNTLIYRIDKIQSITGLNIRHFDDALTFKMLLTIYKLTN